LKRLITGIVLLAVIVSGGVFYYARELFRYAESSPEKNGKHRIITVDQGQSIAALARMLESEGIIRFPDRFRLYARLKGYDRRIKAGEYSLSSSMSPAEILQAVVRGKVNLYRITIPEGYDLKQISQVLAESELGPRPDFLKASADRDLLALEGIHASSFEGYLFPDTYHFSRPATTEKIIHTMVKRFREVFGSEWVGRADALGYSIHDVVTLASIIEKETGAPFERPLISSVFHNRLERRMRLESDPTVIYGIADYDGNITRVHLNTDTPYNTYVRHGLPPGPIANPGRESLRSALYPAETEYLYFVSKGDGTHQFSTNIQDHNRAVRRYQLRR